MYSNIHLKIAEANGKYAMFEENSSVLVALSGGADSVCLLSAIHMFYPKVKLVACHVNHMLRGDEADRDEQFVRELCEKYGIELEVLKTDVAAFAKAEGLSTELAARKVRYGFFEDVCKKHGINLVATAHTSSDNAETVLFNLIHDPLERIPQVYLLHHREGGRGNIAVQPSAVDNLLCSDRAEAGEAGVQRLGSGGVNLPAQLYSHLGDQAAAAFKGGIDQLSFRKLPGKNMVIHAQPS